MDSFASQRNVVVIGGGIAGTTCAAELSVLFQPSRIRVTLIDSQPAVKRSTVVAEITRTAVDVNVCEKDALEWSHQVGVRFVQDRVVSIHPGFVQCVSGAKFSFDACCIATGARPYIPPVLQNAIFFDRILTLRDTDSVESLKSKLATARRVIVIGGGGIALELVHEITGCDVVWIMKGGHVGSAFWDERSSQCLMKLFGLAQYESKSIPEGSTRAEKKAHDEGNDKEVCKELGSGVGPEWISRRYQPVLFDKSGDIEHQELKKYTKLQGSRASSEKSVQVLFNCEVTKLSKEENGKWAIVATLSDGSEVGCDLILACTGVTPNTEWLAGSEIEVAKEDPQSSAADADGGILVSAESMCTNIRGIFAAGDCTTVILDTAGENWFQMRLWTQARASGKACAQSMAAFLRGEEPECAGLDFDVFAHATQFFGMKLVLLGRYNAQGLEDGYELVENGGEEKDGYYVRVVLQGGRVRGALLVGNVDKAETFENLILDGLDVGRFGADLVDPALDIEDYFD